MRSPLPYWFILIFGTPGQGKSIHQAYMSYRVLKEFYITEKRYPQLEKRILYTNQVLNYETLLKRYFWYFRGWFFPFLFPWRTKFSKKFLDDHIVNWKQIDEFRYCKRQACWRGTTLHNIHDVDIFIDEGGRLFPPERWKDTEQWIRDLWTEHRKYGIRFLVLTLDFNMMDINARRPTWRVYFMEKWMGSRDPSPTLPPLRKWTIKNFITPRVNVVWGIYTLREFSPLVVKLDTLAVLTVQTSEEKSKIYEDLNLMKPPVPYLITWFKCSLYDTAQEISSKIRR